MTEKQETTQEKSSAFFEGLPFMAMMQKMMGQPAKGGGCAEMMSQMMGMCCGTQDETKEKTTSETTQQA